MLNSNILYIATIIIAANVAFGMNLKAEVNKPQARRTTHPVTIPPIGVFTPEVKLTAVLVKLPVTGIDFTKLPIILQRPSAIISCVASKDLPLAAKKIKIKIFEIIFPKILFTKINLTKRFCNGNTF